MQHKQIVTQLLNHYKDNLVIAKQLNEDTFFYFINKVNIEEGVCLCANRVFGVRSICKTAWVKKYCKGIFWGKLPYKANTKEEAIELIQLRIDNLEKELAEINSYEIKISIFQRINILEKELSE